MVTHKIAVVARSIPRQTGVLGVLFPNGVPHVHGRTVFLGSGVVAVGLAAVVVASGWVGGHQKPSTQAPKLPAAVPPTSVAAQAKPTATPFALRNATSRKECFVRLPVDVAQFKDQKGTRDMLLSGFSWRPLTQLERNDVFWAGLVTIPAGYQVSVTTDGTLFSSFEPRPSVLKDSEASWTPLKGDASAGLVIGQAPGKGAPSVSAKAQVPCLPRSMPPVEL